MSDLFTTPRENGDDDVERLRIGDSEPAVGLLRDLQGLKRGVDPFSSAVNDDDLLSGRPARGDGAERLLPTGLLLEKAPAQFHDRQAGDRAPVGRAHASPSVSAKPKRRFMF